MSVGRARVSATDIALLEELANERSVVAASRKLGISRDSAVYRLKRLEATFGGPIVVSARGGPQHGRTGLTALGDRISRRGFESVELVGTQAVGPRARPNYLRGVFRAGPPREVVLPGGLRLRVAFPADDGERVGLLLDPESILVAPDRFPSSARNVLDGTIEAVRKGPGPAESTLVVATGSHRLRVAIAPETVRALALGRGGRVWLYVKATALRRVEPVPARPTRGSPRS